MKVVGITVHFEDEHGTKTTAHRDNTFLWTLSGGVYPAALNLVNTINDLCREFDRNNVARMAKDEE